LLKTWVLVVGEIGAGACHLAFLIFLARGFFFLARARGFLRVRSCLLARLILENPQFLEQPAISPFIQQPAISPFIHPISSTTRSHFFNNWPPFLEEPAPISSTTHSHFFNNPHPCLEQPALQRPAPIS
jgi:hypothetical protein